MPEKIFSSVKNFRYKNLSFPNGRRMIESTEELKIIKEIPHVLAVITDRTGKILNPAPQPKKKKKKKKTKSKEAQDVQNSNGKKRVHS